ncbi:helix-turn-helix domain-containing protein [Nonomuraea deserti]|uniref:helix-turn-helix domain-containing protein n=1 Tax=Nonomuraea deserti TaxID=1848322 RepID=UPI001FEBAAC7|nr:helix-turn-helix domain-containing protein [Nonomuraea deserti]
MTRTLPFFSTRTHACSYFLSSISYLRVTSAFRRRRNREAGYKYRSYPTPGQADELARTFGCVRLVYNKALEGRTRAFAQRGRRVSCVESSAALTQWRGTLTGDRENPSR